MVLPAPDTGGMPWVYVYINALWNRIDDAPNAL